MAIQAVMNMHRVAVLLRSMRMLELGVPKHPRMLLAVPRNIRVQKIEGVKHIHFGLEGSMQQVVENYPDIEDDDVEVRLHVDRPSPLRDSFR